MKSTSKSAVKLLAVLGLLSILFSCGSKPIGYGVMLINDESGKNAGDIIPVYSESEIRKAYVGIDETGGKEIDYDKWKLSFFQKEADAAVFASEYAEYAPFYAEIMINGLSIRKEPSAMSDRVYKLRKGQIVKIISRSEETENIADHDGYWYYVITEDGTFGYCFDLNIAVFNKKLKESEGESELADPMLEYLYTRTYRPEAFRTMADRNMIDLLRFKKTVGLTCYPEKKRVELVTETTNIVYEYTGLTKNNRDRFIFEGTPLQIMFRNPERISVYYSADGREFAENFFYIEDMDGLIQTEADRRQQLYNSVVDLSPISSSAYGSITFGEDYRFVWNDYRRLVPNVIPEALSGAGTVSLRYLPGYRLKDSYDGVLSLAFDGTAQDNYINFLFQFSDLGMKLVYVPAGDIEKNLVERESASPLVLFMAGTKKDIEEQ